MAHKEISINASGTNNELIAAVAGKRIVVKSGVLVGAGSVTLIVRSGSTALSGAMSLAAATVLPFAPIPRGPSDPIDYGHFVTAVGEALNATLSSGVVVAGYLIYDLID